MEDKILLTKEKKQEIEKELKHLLDVERPQVIKAIQDAREQGDLSENADYDAAKNRQAEIESKIQELENILHHVQIIDEKTSSKKIEKVRVGTTVELYDSEDEKNYSYSIVGEVEADPEKNKISNVCPLALAILGHEVGDIVEIKGIEKPYKVKIQKISRL